MAKTDSRRFPDHRSFSDGRRYVKSDDEQKVEQKVQQQ